jgi:hypothetical protein
MIQLVRNSHVSHCDQKGHNHSIYSLDFQFGGSRLATGGGGLTLLLSFINRFQMRLFESGILILYYYRSTVKNCPFQSSLIIQNL